MPALNHPHTQRLTLNNGLTLSVRHEPRLKRCAAVLRVAAGSHDVPGEWPGLAHFLEHLLFLGSERFPPQDNLMAYVQRHGGQVNARTSERHTDFFFELPPSAFAGGLERLCDMLANPCMNMEAQLREREVLHAEFIAWAREPSAQRQLKWLQPLNPAHPLRAFHAGNRYSLPVPRPSFQQALKDFYQQFYQTGQMTLSLAGPQSVSELEALAEHHSAVLHTGKAVPQMAPPALMTTGEHAYQHIDGQHLSLMFAFDQLPPDSAQALAFLCHWISADKPGGLVAALRQQHLIDTLKAIPVYHFERQALLHIEFSAASDIAENAPRIREMFCDWLSFFSAQAEWPTLRDEYQLLQQRQQAVSGAMELARRDVVQHALQLSDQGVTALKSALQQMLPTAQPASAHNWQLPAPNPFLKVTDEPVSAGLIRGQTSAHRGLRTFAQDRLRGRRDLSAMSFSSAIAPHNTEASVYLRWRLPGQLADTLLTRLQTRLRSLQQDARQAGVELVLSTSGPDLLLKMQGFHTPMPTVMEHALRSLAAPSADACDIAPAPPLMPIRHLLKRLPEIDQQATATHISDLEQCWASAQWDGLAVGLPASTQTAMASVLSKVPGTPNPQHPQPSGLRHAWHLEPGDSTEQALLVFCPAPIAHLADEAAWRMLAHLAQTPCYQKLRVELQLGYAVFSGLRQMNGQTGLLFGVQSPHASVAEIYGHIETFIAELPTLITALDETSFTQARASLAQQFSNDSLGAFQAAELLWQAKLAGHPSDYLAALYNELMALDQATTLRAAQRIAHAENGWLCLATQAAPETFYQGRSGSLPTLQ